MSHRCPFCGYGCQTFNEQYTHDCDKQKLWKKINDLEAKLKNAELALRLCIEDTGGYTGGAPQRYFEGEEIIPDYKKD